jgi:hypothetical protein
LPAAVLPTLQGAPYTTDRSSIDLTCGSCQSFLDGFILSVSLQPIVAIIIGVANPAKALSRPCEKINRLTRWQASISGTARHPPPPDKTTKVQKVYRNDGS